MSLNVMQATFGYHPQEGPQNPKRSFTKFPHIISTPLVCTIYIKFKMKKNSKHVGLAQQNGFAPIICAPDVEACKRCKNKA
jgi:hypothetical protein